MSLTAGNLFISSYNNQDFDTSTDFTITLAVPVTNGKRLRMLGATIANLFMPFGFNDKLWEFKVGATTYTMNFDTTIRWATIADFLTYVNSTLFVGASPSAVPAQLSYNADKNQLYLEATTVPTDVITMPGWNWNNVFGTSVAYNANYRLGWTSIVPVVSTDVGGVQTLYADGFPNVFNRTNVVYVTTNICSDSNNDANIANIFGRIAMTSGWGSLVNYENVHSEFSSPIFTANVKDVRIRLLDEDYQVLVNPSNAYFNIVIGIEY